MTKHVLSHRERMQRSVIPWATLLVIVLGIGGFFLAPELQDWWTKRQAISEMKVENADLRRENIKLKSKKSRVQADFQLAASGFQEREKQVFPESIDPHKVARILEIYALSLENLRSKSYASHFEIKNLNIGNTNKDASNNRSKTPLSMVFSADERNMKTFIEYLQSGELSDRFVQGYQLSQIKLIDYKYLENNILPVMLIDSIRIKPIAREENSPTRERFDIDLQATMFSQ